MQILSVVAAEGRDSQGLVSAAAMRQAGISRSAVARAVDAGALLRVRRRVYSVPPLPRFLVTDAGVDPAYVAHARAVLLSLGPAATAAGRTAAALHGWGMLVEPGRTLEVAVPHGRHGITEPLVRVTQRRSLARIHRVVLPGTAAMWVSSPVQTVVDCALTLPLMPAVVVCDSALRSGEVAIEELVPALARLRGVREARRVREVLDHCDPLSGSVLETVLRVRMLLAGITGFTSQRVLRDVPGAQLRVDFCFVDQGLVVEVDGVRWHQDPARDRLRDNALAGLGWRVLRFTWSEVVHEPERVLDEIRAALARATPGVHLLAPMGQQAA